MEDFYTKEEIDWLHKDYSPVFKTVIYQNYKRGTKRSQDVLLKGLLESKGEKNVNLDCPICVFNLYKRAGQKYYAQIEKYQKKKEEIECTESEPTLETNELQEKVTDKAQTKTVKRGRKKKNA